MCVAAGSREQGQDDEKMSCTAAAQRVDVLTRAGGDLRPVQRSSARVARRAKAPGASADGGEPNVPHRQDVGSGTVCDSLGPAGRVCARPPAANDRSDRLSWRCPPPPARPPSAGARARASRCAFVVAYLRPEGTGWVARTTRLADISLGRSTALCRVRVAIPERSCSESSARVGLTELGLRLELALPAPRLARQVPAQFAEGF